MTFGIETWRDSVVFLAVAAFTGRLLLWLVTHDGWTETGRLLAALLFAPATLHGSFSRTNVAAAVAVVIGLTILRLW